MSSPIYNCTLLMGTVAQTRLTDSSSGWSERLRVLNSTAYGTIFQYQHFWRIECNPSGPPLFSCSKVWHGHLNWIYWRMARRGNSQSLRRDQVRCKRSVVSILLRRSPLTDLGLSESFHAEISPLGLRSIFRARILSHVLPSARSPQSP